jgi:putative N6-adenine-specific DNA methylase
MSYTLFAVSAPGLEPFTQQEIDRLSAAGIQALAGGVSFQGTLRDIYRANLHLLTASRILVRLEPFYAAAFSELRKKARRLPWEQFLAPGQPVAVKATCHKSKLYHSDAVAERVLGAIEDRLGKSAPQREGSDEAEDNPAQLIVVRLERDQCQISVDSSGELLHRRGYRLATAKAPLRETLAAGMLMASGWTVEAPLIDPFCGSGTIAIEAARMVKKIAPGRSRNFAFMGWPDFDAALWQSLLEETDTHAAHSAPRAGCLILASDRDAGAIEAARDNAQRAGVSECIEFSHRAVSAIEPPHQPGWIVTNPPYGLRISQRSDLRDLYAQFGNVLRAKCPGWHVAMLAGGYEFWRHVRLSFDAGIALTNGGVKVRLVRATVPVD